jgi:hypothetical protein
MLQEGCEIKDIIQMVSVSIGIVAGVIAAFKAIYEWKRGLLWQKVQEAKKLLDALYENPFSKDAMRMLDYIPDGRYHIIDGQKVRITIEDIKKALKTDDSISFLL